MEPTEENLRAWDAIRRSRAEPTIPDPVRALLPDLRSKHVLQLVCGTGAASAELAALGAFVTGVDSSEQALDVARKRAANAVFVKADFRALPAELLRARFDLVYADGGVLEQLEQREELELLASQVATALRSGGEFLLHDSHPVAACLDLASLRWREDYFDGPWRLGEIVSVVAAAGLFVRHLDEFRATAEPRRQDPRIPAEFALVASKP